MSATAIQRPRFIDLLSLDKALAAYGATRRRVLGILGGLGASVLLGPVASAQEGTPVATEGEWTFTDDAGKTVTLAKRPERIAADLKAAAWLWDFGIKPVSVSGWTVETDTAWGNVDRSTPIINAAAGAPEPDLEKLLALRPDLFVTGSFNKETPYDWTFPDVAAYERVNAAVPVVAISGTGSVMANIERTAELAALLGADLDAPELVAATLDVDKGLAALEAFAADHPDLTTLFMSANGEAVYIANPVPWAELAMYRDLGLNLIMPDAAPNEYWQSLSIEQATMYPADVVFQSTRAGTLSLEDLQAHPTYGQHPAVAAGQIGPWNQDFVQSYQGLVAALDVRLATLKNANDVTK